MSFKLQILVAAISSNIYKIWDLNQKSYYKTKNFEITNFTSIKYLERLTHVHIKFSMCSKYVGHLAHVLIEFYMCSWVLVSFNKIYQKYFVWICCANISIEKTTIKYQNRTSPRWTQRVAKSVWNIVAIDQCFDKNLKNYNCEDFKKREMCIIFSKLR